MRAEIIEYVERKRRLATVETVNEMNYQQWIENGSDLFDRSTYKKRDWTRLLSLTHSQLAS